MFGCLCGRVFGSRVALLESEVVRMKDWKGWIVCPCCGGENILEDYSAFKKNDSC